MNTLKQELIKKISQKNIVIFTGAGISIDAGLPDWSTLIKEILNGVSSKEPKSDKFKQALDDEIFTPVDVLAKISYLRTEAIEILDSEIRKYDDSTPTKIHSKIGKIAEHIITTNYDNLLEKALPSFEQVVYTNDYKIAKLSSYEKYIFKIHGDIHEPNKCILFPSEYDKLYSAEEKTSTFELKKIISDKSILFIGFSFTDPYVSYIFDYINNLYSGFNPEHYIITTDKDRIWPKKINPILINSHKETEALLDELVEGRNALKEEQNKIKSEIETKAKIDIIKISDNYDYDSPPTNKFWVGREKELENINNGIFKVIFITGIGGQGKSALAAHYIRNYFETDTYDFADWRDFKEEANRFHTKMISIIKRLNPEVDYNFETFNNNDLVDTFFHLLQLRKIIFVFDNIDNYIDLETFRPTGSFGYFYDQIVSKDHKSKFIFTCRPFIREAGVDFYQITLSGISEMECAELFKFYNIQVNNDDFKSLVSRAHKLTKGHPLWLNLIAGQAIRGVNTVNEFMTEIEGKTNFSEDNFSSILSEKILSVVWNSLNDKQRLLIRGIAETVKPETEENLRIILDSELNANQFYKSVRTLKNLNLVETLKEGEIELHPLVKEYVLTRYPKNERAKFITLFVKFYDKFIYILKPNLNSKLGIQDFQNWTLKIELQINKNDFIAALVALEEVSRAILAAGYSEEYLRVAHKLYDAVNWEIAIAEEYSYFHSQLYNLTTTLTQMGNCNEANVILEHYKRLIPGKSAHYLGYCSEKIYYHWYQADYDKAIQIGEEGASLLQESNLADSFSLKHNLGLAYRDSMIKINIEKALKYFSSDDDLNEFLLSFKYSKDLGGAYYGNIGRCLEFLDRKDDALKCYFVSFKLLVLEDYINSIINTGYACLWIGAILSDSGKNLEALYFLKLARNCWDITSPPRSKDAMEKWNSINIDINSKNRIEETSDWKIKDYCSSFVADKIF